MSQGLWELYRRGLKPLAGLTKPGRSQGGTRRNLAPGPPGWGLGVGLTTPPYKIHYVRETTTMETTTRGPIADLSQPGSMTTPAKAYTRKAGVRQIVCSGLKLRSA